MAMKYNESLDYVLASMVQARKGNTVLAGKLFAKAITASDFMRGAEILETSNANAEGAPVAVTAAPKKAVKAAAAAPAPKAKVSAKKTVTAGEDEFDMGDDADLEALVGEGEGDDDEDDGLDVDAGFEDGEDEDEEDPVLDSEQFAAVLASMTPQRKARR